MYNGEAMQIKIKLTVGMTDDIIAVDVGFHAFMIVKYASTAIDTGIAGVERNPNCTVIADQKNPEARYQSGL